MCLCTMLKKGMIICNNITVVFQSYPGPSLESEDFNIPPITPPSLPDHPLVHVNEVDTGYHSLCHPMNHNGLLPFHPQNMDLPEITVSNLLGQDGTLLTNSISVVRTCSPICGRLCIVVTWRSETSNTFLALENILHKSCKILKQFSILYLSQGKIN